MARCLASAGHPAHLLKLEPTEGSLPGGRDELGRLEQLRALGVQLWLDDFGAGFSSLSRLHEVVFDELKVDRRFLMSAGSNPRSRAIVGCITRLAGELGIRSVAEGIEEPKHLALARELGFDVGQGYLFARPAPAEETFAWLAAGGFTAARVA